MSNTKIINISFSLILPLFLLLLSYKLTLAFFPLTLEQQNTLQFLQGSEALISNYTAAEVSHLQDVTRIMNLVDLFFYGSGVIILGFLLYFKRKYEQLQALLKLGGITTLSSIFLFFLAIVFRFENAFMWFHQIFFPQGNWQFPVDSLLIKTFSLAFFIKISIIIAVLTLALGSLF